MNLTENIQTKAAVLLIVFNRPEQTRHVVQKLRENTIEKLYVAMDGPRPENGEDMEAQLEIAAIINGIDWDCEVVRSFQKENLGGGLGPATAISWAFEHEDRLIILEDDCVPAKSFFNYCNELLERYKDDSRIWHISGNNYNEEFEFRTSYTFSHFPHIWGWATWKRCWDSYDLYLSDLENFERQGGIDNVLQNKKAAQFYTKKYRQITENGTARPYTWDYQLGLNIYNNNGLCVVPRKNLVTNIGYVGEHTEKISDAHNRPADESFAITNHPDFVVPNRAYDRYHFKYFINRKKPLTYRVANRLRKIVNSLF